MARLKDRLIALCNSFKHHRRQSAFEAGFAYAEDQLRRNPMNRERLTYEADEEPFHPFNQGMVLCLRDSNMTPTIYLSGPIMDCPPWECKGWRDEVIVKWPGKCLDPMRRNFERNECAKIVEADLEDIDQSDALLVNITRFSVGTSMEIMYASMKRKPVFMVYVGDPNNLSPWLQYHAYDIYLSIDAALDAIKDYHA